MPAPRKFDAETRVRAVRMYQDRIRDHGDSKIGARRHVGELLGINPATLRNWAEREEVDSGAKPGVPTDVAEELKGCDGRTPSCAGRTRSSRPLRRFSRRRSSTTASGDPRLPRRPPGPVRGRAELPRAVRAWDPDCPEHRVHPPCRTCERRGAGRRLPGQRAGGRLPSQPQPVRVPQGLARDAPRWPHHRPGPGRPADADRRDRRRAPWPPPTVTTVGDQEQSAPQHPDLVQRAWATPTGPDQWWVADFTYVWTLAGFVSVSFVTDVYSRRILGWRVSTSKTTPLVTSALEQALGTRQRADTTFTATGLVPPSDAGSQYTSLAFTYALVEAGIAGSIGSVGDALDNALMESPIGLFKTELIDRQRSWTSRAEVERETAAWVHLSHLETRLR